jgi:O-acetyl-ADP-ribose deacetylase (regulator of RNase III)
MIGDATEPCVKPALICHVCNSVGAWGSGFVVALSKKNKAPEAAYRKWFTEDNSTFGLGALQIASFAKGILVANMIAQKGLKPENGEPPLRYSALTTCLKCAYRYAKDNGLTVHMPRIGAVRGGGNWEDIEKIVKDTMTVETYVYTLPSEKNMWPIQYENDVTQPADTDSDIDLNAAFK